MSAAGEFTGRTALVTGAGRGIGRAVLDALAGAGATVVGFDLDLAGLPELPARGPGRTAAAGPHGLRVDVADRAAAAAAVDRVQATLGPIDILVNVAGILRTASVLGGTDLDWDLTFAVNVGGVRNLCRAVAPGMVERRRGAIVTVGSNAAGVPRLDMAAYGASKAAAALFTKTLGLELASHGVRCNVVSPGSTDTPMQRGMWDDPHAGVAGVIAGQPERFKVGIPLGRIADPADIADAVLFLVSDRARHITMHDLYVDGGATLRV